MRMADESRFLEAPRSDLCLAADASRLLAGQETRKSIPFLDVFRFAYSAVSARELSGE
jgi:hypothetical protein